jgi:hypothetical protein
MKRKSWIVLFDNIFSFFTFICFFSQKKTLINNPKHTKINEKRKKDKSTYKKTQNLNKRNHAKG